MYQMVCGKKELLEVHINKVDVSIEQGKKITLPIEVFSRSPKAIDLIDSADQVRLEEIGVCANNIASNAFEYWLSILRWKCDSHRIGRPVVSNNDSGWAAYLSDAKSSHDVWATTTTFRVVMDHIINAHEWNCIQIALEACEKVPTYINLLDDAREYHSRHEYRRSMIDLAIACEVFLRTFVLQQLPSKLDSDISTMISEVNISQYLKFFPNFLNDDGKVKFKKIKENLTSLFDARNKIMHMAINDRATNENCLRFIDLTKNLFDLQKNLFHR